LRDEIISKENNKGYFNQVSQSGGGEMNTCKTCKCLNVEGRYFIDIINGEKVSHYYAYCLDCGAEELIY